MGWRSRTSSCIAILIGSVAVAHPMGENSVNQYLLLRVQSDGVHVGYRIDFAENATATELRTLDANSDGTVSDEEHAAYLKDRTEEWASRMTTMVDGKEVAPKVSAVELKLTDGGAGRKTMLVMIDM